MRSRIGQWVVGGFGALSMLAMLVAPAQGAEKKKKPEPVKPTEMTLSGTISKAEVAAKKEGGKPTITYTLATREGEKIALPVPKPEKKKKGKDAGGEQAVINLDDYLDVPVNVTVMAVQTKKGEKTITKVVKVLKIEKAADAEPGEDGGDMDDEAGGQADDE